MLSRHFCTSMFITCLSTQAIAISIDGRGSYSLRGESRQSPNFQSGSSFQAIDQFFRLETEIRSGDHSSFHAEFRLFDQNDSNYLGDTSQPQCSPRGTQGEGDDTIPFPEKSGDGSTSDCLGRPQNAIEPGYEPYSPRITQAYARYNSDLCLLTAGRRARHWGMGVFLNGGKGPFDKGASVYDGVSCDFNIQKSQTMGFQIGYDKISETGSALDLESNDGQRYGATRQGDDLDQIFFSLVHDDTHTGNAQFSKKIGIYFANIMGSSPLKTDIKIADLALSFYTPSMIFQTEIISRLGKSMDPNLSRLGGRPYVIDGQRNDVSALAIASRFDYIFSQSGTLRGPAQYHQGDLTSHGIFFELAYAPGDQDGYIDPVDDEGNVTRTDTKAEAFAFHQNYQPALLLFNGRQEDSRYRLDGIYDPQRLMNTSLFAFGYEYKSLDAGKFTLKLISASLNQGITAEARAEYESDLATTPGLEAPVGYAGKDLGWEIDLSWDTHFDKGFQLGGALALARPGKALDINPDKDPKQQLMLQSYISLLF